MNMDEINAYCGAPNPRFKSDRSIRISTSVIFGLTFETRSESARKGVAARTPEERSAAAKKWQAARTPKERSESAKKREAAMTPEARSESIRKGKAAMTPEARSESARKGVAAMTPEARSESAKKISIRHSRPCTVDGVTIYESVSALVAALGNGKHGYRSPNFRYVGK